MSDDKFGKTNLANSAIVLNHTHVSMSLHIPQLKSVMIVQPNGDESLPETDFTKEIGEGLGITDDDLYYITVPINGEARVVTVEDQIVIVECTEDGIKEVNL